MLNVNLSKSHSLVLKCLKVFYKKRGRIKFRKMCFLLNESPSKLHNDKTFRSLVTEGVFTPLKAFGNPDQEYEYDWWKLRDIYINSELFNDLLDGLNIKAVFK